MQNERICPLCKNVVAGLHKNVKEGEEGFCEDCKLPFREIWVLGWREGALAKMIKAYKYQGVRAIGDTLAEMVDAILPKKMSEMVIVPLPTIGKHVRERGIDHTMRLAKKLGQRRGWKVEKLLGRAADTVQVGAKLKEREEQARKAYMLNGRVEAERKYLLLDDVWTSGATMMAAAKLLREAGAKEVYGMVLATGRPKKQKDEEI